MRAVWKTIAKDEPSNSHASMNTAFPACGSSSRMVPPTEISKTSTNSSIRTALHDESLFPPQCCTSQIPKSAIRDALSFSQYRDYHIRVHEFSTPIPERIYCPHRWCGAFIPPRFFPTDITHFECPTCFRYICRFCKQKIHGRGNKGECPNDEHLNALVEVAEKRGWKRCFKCKAYVELTSGCDHM